jgi:hypothetical protein
MNSFNTVRTVSYKIDGSIRKSIDTISGDEANLSLEDQSIELAINLLRYYFPSPLIFMQNGRQELVSFSIATQYAVRVNGKKIIPDFIVSKLMDNSPDNDFFRALFMEVKIGHETIQKYVLLKKQSKLKLICIYDLSISNM